MISNKAYKAGNIYLSLIDFVSENFEIHRQHIQLNV